MSSHIRERHGYITMRRRLLRVILWIVGIVLLLLALAAGLFFFFRWKFNPSPPNADYPRPANALAAQRQDLDYFGKLLAMDPALLPNLKNLDPKFLKPSYDPTGQYHVIQDYGITMIFYNNQVVTERPTPMPEFYALLPKSVGQVRPNVRAGAEGGGPAGAVAASVGSASKNARATITRSMNELR